MDIIRDIVENMGRYWVTLSVWDVFDILIVAIAIYKLIQLMRRSNAMQVLRGIVLLLAVMLLSQIIGLRMVNAVLSNAVQIGLFAVMVLFQPELRKMLEQMGAARLPSALRQKSSSDMGNAIGQTVSACGALSWRHEGALIVFERSVVLDDIAKSGTLIDAEVTAELLKNIFYPKAPLHDGAAIIQNGRIASAGCMLPLTGQMDLNRELGMRHRAGIGMSEDTDALVVIVSEETGGISVAKQGTLTQHLTPEGLDEILRQEFMPRDEDAQRGFSRLFGRARGKKS